MNGKACNSRCVPVYFVADTVGNIVDAVESFADAVVYFADTVGNNLHAYPIQLTPRPITHFPPTEYICKPTCRRHLRLNN